MEEFNKYIKIWQTCILKMNDSISKKDFDSADEWERKADEAYEKYKEDTKLEYENESRNFGELHYMLENAIPLLFKKKPNVLKQCMKTIKEDKNLLSQFKFYSALSAYDSSESAKDYIKESLEFAEKSIDKSTVKESVRKFASLLSKNEIGAKCEIDEDTKKYFDSCTSLMTEEKKINNLKRRTDSLNYANQYVLSHRKENSESLNINKLTENLTEKFTNLNEDEQGLVKDIIDFKKPYADKNKEDIFNQIREECINKVNSMISGNDNENELYELKNLKEDLTSKKYCSETIVKDMVKLLEIRDILTEDK